MSTDQRTIDLLLERLAVAGEPSARKMFGEYGIYCDGVFIGVVCDDRFHVKPTKQGLAFAPELELAPAYDGAKPSMVVPGERWDDQEWLRELVRITVESLRKTKK